MITPATKNPDGTFRKHSRNKTFVLDPKACEIRTYTRSSLTNEVGIPNVETFGSLASAETRFKYKR